MQHAHGVGEGHRGVRVNGEFYTCPVYNYLIRDRLKIGIYDVAFNKMHGMGTPEDLTEYLSLLRSSNA